MGGEKTPVKQKNGKEKLSEKDKEDEDVGTGGDETTDDEGGVDTPPPSANNHDEDYVPEDGNYEVDQIVDMEVKRRWKCPVKFRVRWVGYGEKDDTWLPSTDLQCEELINDFLEISGRLSEYKNAMQAKQQLQEESDREMRRINARLGGFSYSELDEDDDEIIPSGTHTRKNKSRIKTPGEKKQLKPTPKRKKKKNEAVSDEYEVEKVIDHRVRGRFTEYKVQWKGWGIEHDSWLPETDLQCDTLIKKYHNEIENLPEEQDYEVESIQNMRETNGMTEYKVRWVGWAPKYDSWLTEEELNCPELLKKFLKTLEALEKQEDWQVEKILDEREKKKGKKEYLVQWLGWGPKYNTWEPQENLEGCNDLLDKFKKGKDKVKVKEEAKFVEPEPKPKPKPKTVVKKFIGPNSKKLVEKKVVTPAKRKNARNVKSKYDDQYVSFDEEEDFSDGEDMPKPRARSNRASGKRSYSEFYDE